MDEKKYSIEEIKYYLDGCLLMRDVGYGITDKITENRSLKNAIIDLEDPEDGIEAVLKGREEQDAQTNRSGN